MHVNLYGKDVLLNVIFAVLFAHNVGKLQVMIWKFGNLMNHVFTMPKTKNRAEKQVEVRVRL